MRSASIALPAALVSLALLGALGCKGEPALAESEPAASQDVKAVSAPLAVGAPAPHVTVTLQDGKQLPLRSLQGQPVIVYFYPKDDTPGCTVEAQGIRDDYSAFEQANVRVLGVSLQDAASHQAFIEKHDLPFDLVVDEGGAVAKAFGVPLRGEYASRQTFLLGADGKITQTWLDVDPKTHSKELLAALAQ
jgi:peroxiredoxin Q/BCP